MLDLRRFWKRWIFAAPMIVLMVNVWARYVHYNFMIP